MDDSDEIIEMGKQGFTCSQMLMLKALELQGKDNPDLVRSMTGFAGGLGWTGDICGVLTGATAVLSLYAGKGQADDEDDPRLMFMIEDLVHWFSDKYGKIYGGIRCTDILGPDAGKIDMQRCSEIIQDTFQYIKELLVNNGFDLSGESLDG